MKKTIVIVSMFTLIVSTVMGLEDTPENRSIQADRYFTAMSVRDQIWDMAEKVAATLPPASRQQFKDLLTKHFDLEAYSKASKEIMGKYFTADELKALADFYGSAVGQSGMKKMGAYFAALMPILQAELGKAQAKAIEDLKKSDIEK